MHEEINNLQSNFSFLFVDDFTVVAVDVPDKLIVEKAAQN